VTKPGITRALAITPLLLTAPLLTACGGGGSAKAAHTASATPTPSTTPSPTNGILDGHLRFTVLSLTCGIPGVTGTHSEAEPSNGQYCEAKLRVVNTDPDYHQYLPQKQRLEGVTSPDDEPDGFAMAVRRQILDPITVQGSDAIEVELWYDVPADAHVVGLRVQGDADAAGFLDNTPVKHSADGVVIPWKVTTPGGLPTSSASG
jgi:hypothetical protein